MTVDPVIPEELKHRGKIQSDTDADKALHVLGRIEARQALRKLEMGRQIEELKEAHRLELDALGKEKDGVKRKLRTWTRARYEAWEEKEGRRSREFSHGRLGMRKSVQIILEIPEEEAVQRLEAAGHEECLRRTVEPDLEALASFDDDALEALGFSRKENENWQVEAFEAKGGKAVA